MLVIVEVDGEVTGDSWEKFCSVFKRSTTTGTKIIVTSRSDKVTKLGTARAIALTYPSSEAYWYFFKTTSFGSTDPEHHPRLASVAMEISKIQSNTTLMGANITATFLRDNFDINIWCKVLVFLRGLFQKHIAKFGGHPGGFLNQTDIHVLGE